MKLNTTLMAGVFSTMTGSVLADCAFENTVELLSFFAGFVAWNTATEAWTECGNIEAELNQELRTLQPQVFAANPSLYQIGGVSSGTITRC